jgi:hypothetical protein
LLNDTPAALAATADNHSSPRHSPFSQDIPTASEGWVSDTATPVANMSASTLTSADISPVLLRNPSSRSVRLSTGILHYDTSEIPEPPALSFGCDIAALDRMWDDASPQWDRSSPAMIRGTPIALIHFPVIYRYRGAKQWQGMKQRWYEWKVAVSYLLSLGY